MELRLIQPVNQDDEILLAGDLPLYKHRKFEVFCAQLDYRLSWLCINICLPTSVQDFQWFQQTPAECVKRVLHAGTQAERALEVRLTEQKFSVGLHLGCPA